MRVDHGQFQFHLLLLSPLSFASIADAKSVTDRALQVFRLLPSLLSYLLPWDSKLSEVASRFQVNISRILAANSKGPTAWSSAGNQIIPAKSLIIVPISCPCTDDIRRSISTIYTVKAAGTLELMVEGYGGLVMSAEQIRSFNGGNGLRVRRAWADWWMHAACRSANLRWYNESLILANGSCALTAHDCIKCSCTPIHLYLRAVFSVRDHALPQWLTVQIKDLTSSSLIWSSRELLVVATSPHVYAAMAVARFHLVNSPLHGHCSTNESYWETAPMTSPESRLPSISLPSSIISSISVFSSCWDSVWFYYE